MAKQRFDIITLFPEFFESPLSVSLISKAQKSGLLEIYLHNIRDFGIGKNKQVDDRPFGGGPGMVLKPEVLAAALNKVKLEQRERNPHVILLDPAGEKFTQKKARQLSKKEWLILICGHYEGVDERFKELYVDEEISIGDYVLSGGETAALVVLDVVSRLIPGFLGKFESTVSESFEPVISGGKEITLLDYPVYTRPEEFEGKKIPPVLLSGNHAEITKWREQEAKKRTIKRRPDLLK